MHPRCPKCGHVREASGGVPAQVCVACGLVFSKWARRVLGEDRVRARDGSAGMDGPRGLALREWLLPAQERVDPVAFWGRVATFAVFLVWGIHFMSLDLRTNDIGASFMHRINLVFHEAGHIVFMPFGNFMATLGGTLGQLLMPAIVGAALLIRNRDAFGASLGLWWFAQSVMDCAPYIDDARALQLTLLGGFTGRDKPGAHDWENILLDLGLIEYDHVIARAVDRFGEALMLLAFVWGAFALREQYRHRGGRAGG